MRDDPRVTDLMTRARNGEKQAWDELVERYAPLIWSICRRYRLGRADADVVGQSVWLHLADQLGAIRNPAALPVWLATTTQRECGRVQHSEAHEPSTAEHGPPTVAEHDLLMAERNAVLREALTDLPWDCQQLIAMLVQDPPVPHAEISARLGIPAASIGAACGRCLQRLRRHPAIAALIKAEAPSTGGDLCAEPVVQE